MNLNMMGTHAYFPATLRKLIEDYNAGLADLRQRRADLESFNPFPERRFIVTDHDTEEDRITRRADVDLQTFKDPEAVQGFISARQRERLVMPFLVLKLLDQLLEIRHKALEAWATHYGTLKAKHAEAVAKATHEVEKFKGLSDSAKRMHVQEACQAESDALRATIPEPEGWMGWSDSTIIKGRELAVNELRALVAKEDGITVPPGAVGAEVVR